MDVELIRQPVAFDSSCELLPVLDNPGVGNRPLADHVADVLRRPDDGLLDLEGDVLVSPVLELRASGESGHEFLAVALEPLVWVTSGRLQPV
jgi:hypothetical protein